jgi:hypothetical protein
LFAERFACKAPLIKQPGVAMLGRLRRSEGRQFAAALLIFALMMQSLALAAFRLAADAGPDSSWAGFEICRHSGAANDGGNAAAPAGAPERSDAHCIFCLAGAHHALDTLLPSAAFHTVVLTIVPWSFTALRLPALTVDASTRPRGPPRAA